MVKIPYIATAEYENGDTVQFGFYSEHPKDTPENLRDAYTVYMRDTGYYTPPTVLLTRPIEVTAPSWAPKDEVKGGSKNDAINPYRCP